MQNFLPFIESFISAPPTHESLIQAAWKLEEDRVLFSSNSADPPKDFTKAFDENFAEEGVEVDPNDLQPT